VETLAEEIQNALAEISEFVRTPPFRELLQELWALPLEQRKIFVREVFVNRAELRRRGVRVPPGIVVQRSAFRDGRPTLFCVTKHLPAGLLWEKVTITFDNPEGKPDIEYDELKRLDVRS
jgi:hypothetical protein